jgi:preprotein translocase subunit SecB
MQFRFRNLQIKESTVKAKTFDKTCTHLIHTSLDVSNHFPEDRKSFQVEFAIKINTKRNDFTMKIVAVAHFSTDSEIDPEFRDSSFIRINAPAIAFPYVRAFISNLTLNSGYDPIVLPTYNFVKLGTETEK